MVIPEILKETPVSMAEVKEEIEKIKKRDNEPNVRIQKTEEYIGQFVKHNSKKIQEAKEKITKLDVPRLKEEQIIKIADLLPTTVEDLKLILQGYTLTVSNDNLKKIVEVVKGFV